MATIKPKNRLYDNSGLRSFTLYYIDPVTGRESGFLYRSIIECFQGIAKQKDWETLQGKTPSITKCLGRDEAGVVQYLTIWIDGAFVHEPRVTAFLGNELLDIEHRLNQIESLIRQATEVYNYNGVKY